MLASETSRQEEKEWRLRQLYSAVDGNAAELFLTDRLLGEFYLPFDCLARSDLLPAPAIGR
jgi:hypothetical protein